MEGDAGRCFNMPRISRKVWHLQHTCSSCTDKDVVAVAYSLAMLQRKLFRFGVCGVWVAVLENKGTVSRNIVETLCGVEKHSMKQSFKEVD